MAKKNRSTMTKYRSSLGRPKTTDPKILQQTMEEIMQRKKMDSQNVKMDSQPVRARMLADVQNWSARSATKNTESRARTWPGRRQSWLLTWATVQAARSVPKMWRRLESY